MIELHSPAGLALLLIVGVIAGVIGALTGIGGGAIVVPTLVLALGQPFQTAVAASLAAVIANSGMATVTYLRQGLTHLGLAFRLETFTTVGGIAGGLVSTAVPRPILEAVFSVVQFFSAWLTYRKRRSVNSAPSAPVSVPGRSGRNGTDAAEVRRFLAGRGMKAVECDGPGPVSGLVVIEETAGVEHWKAKNWAVGGLASLGAGFMSGLLGIGGGFLKVPAMNIAMQVPLRVATATSQFMIGITAVAGFSVYFGRGDVSILATAPTVVGMTLGSALGARIAGRISESAIRLTYSTVVLGSGVAFALSAVGLLAL